MTPTEVRANHYLCDSLKVSHRSFLAPKQDGEVDFEEFMTGVGMMKKLLAQSHDLDHAFSEYKGKAERIKRAWDSELALDQLSGSGHGTRPTRRPTITKKISAFVLHSESDDKDERSLNQSHSSNKTSPMSRPPSVARQLSNLTGSITRPPSVAKQLSNLISSTVLNREVENSESQAPEWDSSHFEESKLELVASDLVAFLGIEIEEAEEMIFLADEDEDEDAGTIDRAEFQHLMKTWA